VTIGALKRPVGHMVLRAQRVIAAMLKMQKVEIEALERAAEQAPA
jgi:hypothetical protein